MPENNVPVQVNMHEAKSQLSRLGKLAWAGRRVVIAKAGEPYLELVPHRGKTLPRRPGRFAGQIRISDDFDQTSPEVVAAFEEDS